MQGIVYFGQNSIDITSWSDVISIDVQFDQICQLISVINSCGYAVSQVPEDWYSEKIKGKDFFEWLLELCNGQQDFITYFYTKLHDGMFNSCITKGLGYENAKKNIQSNNPNTSAEEYYGALHIADIWPDIEKDLHVSDERSLYNWALKFLSEHPVSEISFSDRCLKIFTNIEFHDNFPKALSSHGAANSDAKYGNARVTGINGFSIAVTRVLNALNQLDVSSGDTRSLLSQIASETAFECSPEGKNKAHLKQNWGDGIGTINCEFHVKINVSNDNEAGDSTYYQDRLYFGFADPGDGKKIFVYHSGQHL